MSNPLFQNCPNPRHGTGWDCLSGIHPTPDPNQEIKIQLKVIDMRYMSAWRPDPSPDDIDSEAEEEDALTREHRLKEENREVDEEDPWLRGERENRERYGRKREVKEGGGQEGEGEDGDEDRKKDEEEDQARSGSGSGRVRNRTRADADWNWDGLELVDNLEKANVEEKLKEKREGRETVGDSQGVCEFVKDKEGRRERTH